MNIETVSQFWRRARHTSATDNGFPSRVPRLTQPSGNGNSAAQATASAVYRLGEKAGLTQNAVMVMPYGAGADNATMSVRVYGWTRTNIPEEGAVNVWVPSLLIDVAATLSGFTGPAGGTVTTTDRFADTMTATEGTFSGLSPESDLPGYFVVDLLGAQLIEFTFTTGGSATNCNALWRLL